MPAIPFEVIQGGKSTRPTPASSSPASHIPGYAPTTRFIVLLSDNSCQEAASRDEAVTIINTCLSRFARRSGDRIGWNYPHPASKFIAKHPELDGRPTWACVWNGRGEQQEPSGVILPVGFLEEKGIQVEEMEMPEKKENGHA